MYLHQLNHGTMLIHYMSIIEHNVLFPILEVPANHETTLIHYITIIEHNILYPILVVPAYLLNINTL